VVHVRILSKGKVWRAGKIEEFDKWLYSQDIPFPDFLLSFNNLQIEKSSNFPLVTFLRLGNRQNFLYSTTNERIHFTCSRLKEKHVFWCLFIACVSIDFSDKPWKRNLCVHELITTQHFFRTVLCTCTRNNPGNDPETHIVIHK
jgi:hypothetical protein